MAYTGESVGFSWDFLRTMSVWTVAVGVLAAVVGFIITGQIAFATGCLVGAGSDVVLISAVAGWARHSLERGEVSALPMAALFGGRLALKAVLLGLAVVLPGVLGLAGTAVGVLAYDLTVAFVGSIVAITRGRQSLRPGR